MDEQLIVNINKGDVFPEGGRIQLNMSRVKNGKRAYFPRETYIRPLLIPQDTVLYFDKPLKAGQKDVTATAVRGTYSLTLGVHKGSKETKRSSEYVGFESLGALKVEYQRIKADLKKFGYQVWFAKAFAPGDSKNPIQLEEPNSLNEPPIP